MKTFWRILVITIQLLRHVCNRKVLGSAKPGWKRLTYLNPLSYAYPHSRGKALRLFFEKLGPIFIKFGQLLSLRNDLFPADIIKELEKLQDDTPPFPTKQAVSVIENSLKTQITELFDHFEKQPLATASIAQVHSAELKTGEPIIIKVVRPGIRKTIKKDLRLMYTLARMLNRIFKASNQIKPTELVAEFEHTILDELDMYREAANASLLKRNFENSDMMYVPTVYWDYCRTNILVMERVFATKINNIDALKEKNVNLEKLAINGVTIFFTQLLRDNFFHADMHPGNLFIDTTNPESPRYIGVDFGIMGQLSEQDQAYIAENLLAFFKRDYNQVARLHIESGWVPADTRLEQFASSIRAIAEPIFQKPINEISFGLLFLRLIQVARKYKMPVQPQLLLLQKTIISIESLGRNLYPKLNLWDTAYPLIEKWVKEQKGPKQIWRRLRYQWQPNINALIDLPVNLERYLKQPPANRLTPESPNKKPRLFILGFITALVGVTSLHYGTHSAPFIITAGLALIFADRVR